MRVSNKSMNVSQVVEGGVSLVGAGPGDPDLLTLKAVKVLRAASVVLVDDLVCEACLRFVRKSARVVHVGKRGGCASTPQAFIEQLMIREALAGERVVRLKGGDPLVFGRAGEELAALRAAGVKVQVVNGVTSALAAANAVSASLTHRDHAHGVVFVSAHLKDGSLALPFKALVEAKMTLAFYMGITHARELQAALIDAGLSRDTPAVFVERASMPQERIHCTTLAAMCDTLEAQAVQSPAILLIGNALAAAGSSYAELLDSSIKSNILSRICA
jgi:uroporphyrin-III C-methyltransferase